MFGWLWFKKRKQQRALNKIEWKRVIYRHAQTRLLQVKRIMEVEGDTAGAQKIQHALLSTVIACNRNVKRIRDDVKN